MHATLFGISGVKESTYENWNFMGW